MHATCTYKYYISLFTANIDYNSLTQVRISFPNGSNSGDTSCTFVDIIDDALVETDQSFTVEIVNAQLVVVPGEQVTTVIIIDDDGMFLTELLMLNNI